MEARSLIPPALAFQRWYHLTVSSYKCSACCCSNASEGVVGIAERDAHPPEIESLLLLHNVVVLMPVYPASWSLIRSFLLSLSMRCHQTVLCYSPPLPFSFVVMLIWFYLFIYRRFSRIIF